MSWTTVPDDQFDLNNPDPSKYNSLVVGDMHEHGPLWRTDRDGLPLFRTNASRDYPWHGEGRSYNRIQTGWFMRPVSNYQWYVMPTPFIRVF
jgi:hypothetical protein